MKGLEESRAAKTEYKRRWRQANLERAQATRRAWDAANPDKKRAANARWRKNFAEENKLRKKKYWEDNRETLTAKNRARYAEDKDHIRAVAKAKREANIDEARAKARAYTAANRERIRAVARTDRVKKRASYFLYSLRKSAKAKQVDFDLTLEWVESRIPGCCELTGLPFDMENRRSAHSPSVDRIDPHGGYVQSNCRMIVWSLNRAMCNYGQDYLFGLVTLAMARTK